MDRKQYAELVDRECTAIMEHLTELVGGGKYPYNSEYLDELDAVGKALEKLHAIAERNYFGDVH